MTLEESITIREQYLKIIGTKGVSGLEIIDVIIEPLTNMTKFRDEYVSLIRQNKHAPNDILLRVFKSDNYKVSAVLSTDGITQFAFDDINEYKALI